MLGITDYIWRLVPGNPILLRVVDAGGKRKRDLFIRCGYLGFLIVVVCFSLATTGDQLASASLADLAKVSAGMFEKLSYVQLGLIAMLAPIFTAGAITQEKDSQTYDILLATPLTNGQIVLGSLLSRLFFIITLLISGIPIFSITQIFGGVAITGIAMSFGIAAATAFVTGAMAMALATFKVGTRRTIFSFYLVIILFLVGVYFLDKVPLFHPMMGDQTNASGKVVTDPRGNPIPILAKTSWLTGIHPFLALRVILKDPEYTPPQLGTLPANLRGWPTGWYLSSPASFYISFFFFLSLLLVMPSILMLRRVAQSTSSLKTWLLQLLHVSKGNRTRKPRAVWFNPIAWREAKTKASAARSTFIRYGFIILGVGGALTLAIFYSKEDALSSYVDTRSGYTAATAGSPTTAPALAKITLYDNDHNTAKTYPISPSAEIKFNGVAADLDMLHGKFAVADLPGLTQGMTQEISTLHLQTVPRRLNLADVRQWLCGAVIVEFAAILLIVTNAAASTVTREKEDGTLDLLLTSPITSRYYIWGKLRGLVSFVLPLVAVPVVSMLFFVFFDIVHWVAAKDSLTPWVVFPESVLVLPGTLILVAAFAAILGMNLSLRCRTTVRAVMGSIGILMGAVFGLSACGFSIVDNQSAPGLGVALGAFSPFTLVSILTDPVKFAAHGFDPSFGVDPGTIIQNRIMTFFFGWAATAGYAVIVWALYKSMVRNFDMTIRRQSR
jgi:ABC-type transport system involved in multi-copper enzyme maturation permease subunit